MRFRDWPVSSRYAAFGILLLAGLLYLPSMQGQLIWDDHVLVTGEQISGRHSFAACFTHPFLSYYYRPMVSASFFLDGTIWHGVSFGYHQTNLLIHVATTLALMGFLNEVFRNRGLALWGGALFAAQPAQVSTVAWIGGRTDSLCTLFIACFAWCLAATVHAWGWRRIALTCGVVLSYAGAVFTKEQMIGVLPLIPIGFACFGARRRTGIGGAVKAMRGRASVTATLAATAVTVAFIALWFTIGPPRPVDASEGILFQLGVASQSITYYALLLFAPTPMLMHQLCLGTFERAGIWPLIAGIAIICGAAWSLLRCSRTQPVTGWILGLALLTILPVCNLAPLPSLLIAPYRGGVTGLAAAALCAIAIDSLARRGQERRPAGMRAENRIRGIQAPSFSIAAGAIMLAWSVSLAWWGAGQWRDEETIFTTIVRYDPYSIVSRVNLTAALLSKHRAGAARNQLEAMMDSLFESKEWISGPKAASALASRPRIIARIRQNQGNRVEPREWLAALYSQLGAARQETGDSEGSLAAYRAGEVVYESSDIDFGLGEALYRSREFRRAEHYLRRALVSGSERTDILAKLGQVLGAEGKWREARMLFAKCVRQQPWAGQAYVELANAETQMGDRAAAAATLQEAIRRSPTRTDVRDMLAKL